jgi:hypothetical protein
VAAPAEPVALDMDGSGPATSTVAQRMLRAELLSIRDLLKA